MPVNSKHKSLEGVERSWEKIDHCVRGPRVVKDQRQTYLPATRAQEKKLDEYDAYLARALFVPITRRTKIAFQGLVFRREPSVQGVADDLLADATLSGMTFSAFARRTFGYVVAPGRCGVLVDAAPEGIAPAPSRPYLRLFPGGTVLDWREQAVGELTDQFGDAIARGEFGALRLGEGTIVTTHVRLLEEIDVPVPGDEFMARCIPQVRVIELQLIGGQIAQTHQLWRQVQDKYGAVRDENKWQREGDVIVPGRRRAPIPMIPFRCINQEYVGFEVSEPQLLGMADINLSHYRNYADLENARWKLGHPQPYAIGVESGKDIETGSGMWIVPSTGASFGVLQVSDSFGTLERALREKEEAMASEGARLLARPAGAPERTATEAMIDKASERSLVATMADTVSEGLAEICAIWQWWANGTGDLADVRDQVKVELNTDFEAARMTAQEALQWAQLHVMNQISDRTYTYQLRRGDTYPPGWTDEDEAAALEVEGPSSPGVVNEQDAGALPDDETQPPMNGNGAGMEV